jgi:hypothetical protein
MKKYTWIPAFGLEALLTDQDDPALWEAALRKHWPAPASPDCLVDALRFDIGRRLPEGELPQGEVNEQHFNMRGMVDIEEWCFERVAEAQLRIKSCPKAAETAPSAYFGMSVSMMMSGQVPLNPPAQVVFMYLGISRPSRGLAQAVVYAASSAPGVGDGAAHLWQRQTGGRWEQLNQRLAFWIA